MNIGDFFFVLNEYVKLSKPGVSALVVFSAFSGVMLSPVNVSFLYTISVLLCIMLGSCGAAAFNMWYDRDIDSIMERTKSRPIPAGYIGAKSALLFSIICSTVSVVSIFLLSGFFTSFLLAFSIFFYAVIYTVLLKRSTVHNIVIGGVAGSLPPVIGYSAVTGTVSTESLLMFLIIFLWTPPHFWSLSILRAKEYQKVGVPMMPVLYGDHCTKVFILIYSLAILASTIFFGITTSAGFVYHVFSLFISGLFLLLSVLMLFNKYPPISFFRFSIIYLFVVLAGIDIINFA